MTEARKQKGKVFLVGAGPGDPKLLTLRGKECLERADVVLYDYLANPALLHWAPTAAERIYVGRRGRGKYPDQVDINRLLIEKAASGRVVVRLKGGDPFLFGRGGEEAEALAAAGISFEIVPGVTAALGVPAYAGIPVTHRTLASSVTIVTGHEDQSKGSSSLDWARLGSTSGTLVFMMGTKSLLRIVERLQAEGKPTSTPVAIVRFGTRPNQQTVVGTLGDIVAKAEAANLEPPTVIVIGDVVRLRSQLDWFEQRPLFGKRVLVTRPAAQASEFTELLAAYGAEVAECPTIQIQPPDSWSPVDAALQRLQTYDWLVFTSVNGVRPFMERLHAQGKDCRALSGVRVCCIGPRTAEQVRGYGLTPDLIPADYQAEGVIEALTATNLRGRRILIARAKVAREVLPEELRARGAEVDVVPVYQTILPTVDVQSLMDRLQDGAIDVVTFTSSSTVRNFCELFKTREERHRLMGRPLVACIGPVTAQTAGEYGLTVGVMPRENTIPALAEAIAKYFVDEQSPPA
jgi:uroporphyrinogen III methyltransferase/synthase